ncbi:MAG TPA: HAD-IIIC family phosphatase [Candidatus Binatia bacterium]|nr:HAD-IIIC family phosphatase [Candidatus Binatia bacterium]
MTITEALKITQSAPRDARPFTVTLACGFTPLHLQTFLAARLQQALPDRRVTIAPGLFGDLAGTLEAAAASAPADALAIALEWSDLDPRLGYRSAGDWGPAAAHDIVAGARLMLDRVAAALVRIPAGPRIALSLPCLPLPPLFHTPGWLASGHQMLLETDLLHFAAGLGQTGRLAIVNPQRLAEDSPAAERLDLKSDLYTGLPYTMRHADRLAAQLARALAPPAPKKGIISDLDDTLWNGIVGEVGPEAITWDLTSHAQLHGLYQKLLASLARSGTLIAAASKNDPAVVAKAFERNDLLLRPEHVFPVEVHWKAKSGSVARILEAWNIAADSVIFVDDSPMELAEVAAAHPGIECVLFPKDDYPAGLAMMRRLRDLCGREQVSKDDALRLESIRRSAAFHEQASGGAAPESFLQQIGATITFDFAATEPRVLELVNKTNQFNLNGRRYTEADWRKLLSAPGAVWVAVSYEDRFGPLGTIAVVAGRLHSDHLAVESWVMSCRAFARRIEHQTLRMLFEATAADAIDFSFTPTAKNGPLREFFAGLSGEEPQTGFRLTRSQFEANCPTLYHEVRELRRAEAHG